MAATTVAVGALASAWFVQAFLGVTPCDLCLLQRWPYYVGVPLLVCWSVVPDGRGGQAWAAAAALVFTVGQGLAAYHVGVEQGWWSGPAACTGVSGPSTASVQAFMEALKGATVVRCDAVAFRMLGLSLAVWNVVVCSTVAAVALLGSVLPSVASTLEGGPGPWGA